MLFLKNRMDLLDISIIIQYNNTERSVLLCKEMKYVSKKDKKNLILTTAKNLFSQKGYDATGMDEIALTAKVPKSLIYYHFKNKEDLLNTIIENFLNEYKQILADNSQRGIDKITRYMEFLKNNRDSARILVMESLKQTGNQMAIFRSVDTLWNIDSESAEHAHWVTEFFTSIMPAILFVCYEENWNQYFGVQPGVLADDFHNAYVWTHGAYHERIKKESL